MLFTIMDTPLPPPPPPTPLSPPSPLAGARLEDCIEELLKFTILASIKGKLHTGLSDAFCGDLLQHNPSNIPFSINNEVFDGVPSFPMYKYLASSLCQSIRSGAFCMENKEPISGQEDLSFKKKEDEWNKLIVEKGLVLLSLLKEVDFELHAQEPFFSQLTDGLKTVEGRCAVGEYKRIKSGDLLLFNKCLTLQVQDVHPYASFREMLEAESLEKVLPGVKSIEEGVQIYRNFYSEEKEKSNGVLAICVKIPMSQLYDTVASILLGLKYDGVERLLGFVQTVENKFLHQQKLCS